MADFCPRNSPLELKRLRIEAWSFLLCFPLWSGFNAHISFQATFPKLLWSFCFRGRNICSNESLPPTLPQIGGITNCVSTVTRQVVSGKEKRHGRREGNWNLTSLFCSATSSTPSSKLVLIQYEFPILDHWFTISYDISMILCDHFQVLLLIERLGTHRYRGKTTCNIWVIEEGTRTVEIHRRLQAAYDESSMHALWTCRSGRSDWRKTDLMNEAGSGRLASVFTDTAQPWEA